MTAIQKTWTKDNQPDEYFHIGHTFSSEKEETDFKSQYSEHIVFSLTYVPSTEMKGDLEVVTLNAFSKDEIINTINENGGILFEYDPEGASGGWPDFMIMIPKDQSTLEDITMKVYQVEERDCFIKSFEFCSIEDAPIVKNILP